ncbi:DUF620 domain-containing protein, partial [Mongoliimonas terrestris]|uniref:DUF620 domain-containing protein n=1 Tax=Mongoliimonas terrestris TaxID=1709001 RepID=UPI00111510A1
MQGLDPRTTAAMFAKAICIGEWFELLWFVFLSMQGLDPRTTAAMFAKAICIGEKNINGEDCFILKLAADHQTLKARSEGPAEIIRHVLFGYFSQKTGLLVHMEDSHLTRIQSNG